MIPKSLTGIVNYFADSFFRTPHSAFRISCKGASPPPPTPPPVYEPPPALTPPPAAPSRDYTAEREAEELEKNKEKISRTKQGRSSTILTGLLTEAPVTQKQELKKKLGE